MRYKNILFTLLAFIVAGILFVGVYAQELPQDIQSVISAFREYKSIEPLRVPTPVVLEMPFDDEYLERTQFAILDMDNLSFTPAYFESTYEPISLVVIANDASNNATRMIDDNFNTYSEFTLPEQGQGQAQITIENAVPVAATSISILLDKHVALPTSIEIRAGDSENSQSFVIRKKKMASQTVTFPRTDARL